MATAYGFGPSCIRGYVSPRTLAHERAVTAEYTWPALPPHLRALPDARAMVRHWVRTDYQWKPLRPVYTP